MTKLVDADGAAERNPDILEDVAIPHKRQDSHADEKKNDKTDELGAAPTARLLFNPGPVFVLYHSDSVHSGMRRRWQRVHLPVINA